MSRSFNYDRQIADLTEWFAAEMDKLGAPPPLSAHARLVGTDALPRGPYRDLARRAFAVWLGERDYELSYNQICRAFFAAFDRKTGAVPCRP